MVRSLLVVLFPPVLLSPDRKGGHGGWSVLLMCHSPPPLHPPHPLHLHHFRLVCFSNFWINGEALHPTGLCLIWFRATIFSLDPVLPCSVTFGTLMSRQPAAHHPVIQKEVDELLAKGAIELSSGGAGLYSSVFVVPKHTGGLQPILNLKCFNHVICTFLLLRCQLLKLYGSLSSRVIIPFPLIFRMLIYMFPLLRIIASFYVLFGVMCLISGGFLPFGLATAPWVFTSLTKPILFLCHHKGLCIVIYLDDILVLVHSKQAGKRAGLFLCSLLVLCWSTYQFFRVRPFPLSVLYLFRVVLGYCLHVGIFTS